MLTVLEIQTTPVSLWKLQKKIYLFEKKAGASSIKWDI